MYVLANCVIKAGIPDWEEPEKDKRIILREEKAKKKEKEKKSY